MQLVLAHGMPTPFGDPPWTSEVVDAMLADAEAVVDRAMSHLVIPPHLSVRRVGQADSARPPAQPAGRERRVRRAGTRESLAVPAGCRGRRHGTDLRWRSPVRSSLCRRTRRRRRVSR